jgi:hypothetical protein
MSKLVRTLMLGATLAAMSLAAATAVAQEHTTDDAAELFRAGERASQAHREEVGTPPAEAPQPARPDGASRRPGLLLALSVLIVALAAVTTTHATRRIRARQAV